MSNNAQRRISRNEKVAQRLFEERMLVITVEDSILHRFNEVGTFIWQFLENAKSVDEICAALGNHFDEFDKKASLAEISSFVEELEKKGLVTVCDSQ